MLGGLVVSGIEVVVGGVVVVGLVTALHRLFLQKHAVSMSPAAVMLASHCSAVSASRPHLDDFSLMTTQTFYPEDEKKMVLMYRTLQSWLHEALFCGIFLNSAGKMQQKTIIGAVQYLLIFK